MGTESVAGPFPAGFGGMSGRKDVKKQVQGSRRGRQKGGRAEQPAANSQQPTASSQQVAANGGGIKKVVVASEAQRMGSRSGFRLKSGASETLGRCRVVESRRASGWARERERETGGKAAWTVLCHRGAWSCREKAGILP
jgi:hypothetical protein